MLMCVHKKYLKKLHFVLDKKHRVCNYELSLQTLHRMPSEQWGCRPAFPTVFFYS